LPVLVMVSVLSALVSPYPTFPKARDVGVTVAVLTAGIPVPLIATGAPLTATLAAMVREAFESTAAVGVYVTVIVQVEPDVKVAAQVVVREKGAARAPMVMPVAVVLPSLRRVRT